MTGTTMGGNSVNGVDTATQLAESFKSVNHPSALLLYQLGHVLATESSEASLRSAYEDVLVALPLDFRQGLFADLQDALVSLLSSVNDTEELSKALEAVAQLYTSKLARSSTRLSSRAVVALASAFANSTQPSSILTILSSLVYNTTGEDLEELLPKVNVLVEHNVWNSLLEWLDKDDSGWRVAVLQQFSDPAQVEYISTLLLVESKEPFQLLVEKTATSSQSEPVTTIISPQQEVSRRIAQVQKIFPQLGEGFIEVVLAYCKGDVEETIAVLVDDSLPMSLQHLDRSMLRRLDRSNNADDEQEAKLVAKAALEAVQRQQHEEALAIDAVLRHDEYDDDFDDQYLEVDAIGGADSGLYDDYDAVRTYNRALKQIVEEDKYWEDNRNLNRADSDEGTEPEQFRGPDKMPGGRIPGVNRDRGRQTANTLKGKDATTALPNKPNPRKKAAVLANRRDKQKRAESKRSG